MCHSLKIDDGLDISFIPWVRSIGSFRYRSIDNFPLGPLRCKCVDNYSFRYILGVDKFIL